MRICIITQEDYFFIPKNIEKIVKKFGAVSIKTIILIDSKGSINNKKSLFIRGFGVCQTIKYGSKVLVKKLLGLCTYLKLSSSSTHSISAVSNHYKIPFFKVKNINSDDVLERLEELELDIVVSFSAPVIFKKRLLAIPKLGCINLHCSYLPYYAGLFPSFWVLFKNEEYTGCTIHRMDDKIDNGDILKQQKVQISDEDTIYTLLSKTKSIGGDLMVEVIEELYKDELKPIQNLADNNSYFPWPTIDELLIFRNNGRKLI